MSILEDKEWTNLWWDDAENHSLPRIYLVGDSITFGYHDKVIDELAQEARITMMSTSKSVDNPNFIKEMDHVFYQNEYKYDLVHFNNGLHGWHMDDAVFESSYEKTLNHILEKYNTKTAVVLCTPTSLCNDILVIDEERVKVIRRRNAIIQKLADKYHLAVDDLFTPMYSHPEYHVPDGVHFTPEAQKVQAKIVADFIRDQIF